MNRRLLRQPASSRAGLTLTEFIVTAFTILLVMSLFIPAVEGPRGVSRRMQCLENLRQLTSATVSRASSDGGKVPLLTEPAPGLAQSVNVSWPIPLLPYMDQSGAIEYINEAKTEIDAKKALGVVLATTMRSLQCGDDSQRFQQSGGLSYAANIGYGAWRGAQQGVTTAYDFGMVDHGVSAIDWNLNGEQDSTDREFARSTGVFWNADSDGIRLTFDDISNGDGSSTTLLFSESMNLPLMHLAGPEKNGHNPRALDAGFGLGYEALKLAKHASPSLALDRQSPPTEEYRQYFRPNSNYGTASGKWPATSSRHQVPGSGWTHRGGFNVSFADGHGSTISSDINWAVWAALHTPAGTRHGETRVAKGEF